MSRVQLAGAPGGAVTELELVPGEKGTTLVRLRVAGEPVTLTVGWDGKAEGVVRLGARVVPFYALRIGDRVDLWLNGEFYTFHRAEARRSGAGVALPPGGEVTAPMPGLILKVLVRPGDQVEAQAPLVQMESMKMQLTLPAAAAGRVEEVRCQPGQMVDLGAVLVRLKTPLV